MLYLYNSLHVSYIQTTSPKKSMLVVPGTSLPNQRHQPGLSTWLEPFMNPYLPHNYQHPSVSFYNARRKYFDASKNIFHCVFTKICIALGCLGCVGLAGGWREGATWLALCSVVRLRGLSAPADIRNCHHSTIAILDIRTLVILSS